MASEREIQLLRKDPERWGALLRLLIRRYEDVEPRHHTILDSLSEKQAWLEELSYLQAQWLIDVFNEIQEVTQYRGFSVRYMLKCCYENRLDLDEYNEEWLVDLQKQGRLSLRQYEAKRLYSLARRLGDIAA